MSGRDPRLNPNLQRILKRWGKRAIARQHDPLLSSGPIIHAGRRYWNPQSAHDGWLAWYLVRKDPAQPLTDWLDLSGSYHGSGHYFQDPAEVRDFGDRYLVLQRCGYDV